MQNNRKQLDKKSLQTSHSNSDALPKKNILGVGVTDASKESILKYIIETIQKSKNPYYIVTPNPEMIVLSHKNKEFQIALNSAKIALNDGVGVGLAGLLLGKQLHERFTGVDMVKSVCERVVDWPITVGFLGGGPGVAELTAECLVKKYPGLKVGFAGQEWTLTSPLKNYPSVDILFVAFGAPKQEFWMAEHVGKIPVKVMVGVGGAFDQIVNPSLVRPKWFRTLDLVGYID